jgi:hypothetical protein
MNVKRSELLDFLQEGRIFGELQETASWLSGDYHSPVWTIGSNKINWERGLPNDSLLTDRKNCALLEFGRRISFEIRNAPTSRKMNDDQHCVHINNFMCLIDYAVRNQDIYAPHKYLLSRLDPAGLEEFVVLFADGGTSAVSYIIERIQEKFVSIIAEETRSKKAGISCSYAVPPCLYIHNTQDYKNDTFSISDNHIIREWLYRNGFYTTIKYKDNQILYMIVNGRKISSFLGKYQNSFTAKVTVFLRQFEYVPSYTNLEMLRRFKNYEYMPANTYSTEELSLLPICESQFKGLNNTLSSLRRLSGIFEGLPARPVFDSLAPQAIANQLNIRETQHYRTTPVPIALRTMNEAIRFVLVYGEPLVDLTLDFGRKVHSAGAEYSSFDEAFNELSIPSSLIPLKICKARSSYNNLHGRTGRDDRNQSGASIAAKMVRESMSLEDAIIFLIISVYILTASLTAKRKSAIQNASTNCVTGTKGQYDITCDLAKVNFEDVRAEITRPIPNLLAIGLELIKRFTEEWTELFGVSKQTKLFWIPYMLGPGNVLTYASVDNLLNRFSDYIELPIDDNNRRWYIRTHECRRFFAIVFFWQFKYSNLTALQWMLGHADPQHTYAYIKEVLTGSELTQEEARFTSYAIKTKESDEGLDQLRSLVMSHFNTFDVNLIEEDDLDLYLESLLEQGYYKIVPHSIKTKAGVSYKILFEITK